MAKLTRKTAKVFGATASTSGTNPDIGQFGSAKAGTYVGTGDIDSIQALTAWSNGWIDAVTPTQQFPTLPEMTGVHKVLSYQEAYLLQEGVPEYDASTTYYVDSLCKGKNASNELVLFRSKTDDNIGNALTNTTHWEEFQLAANKDLSNLSPLGDSRLHALKSYEDNGENLTDAEGYLDVLNYAHSHFYSSSFTSVGTPVVTSDGIASSLGSGNYLTTSALDFSGTFQISAEFTLTSTPANDNYIFSTLSGRYFAVAVTNALKITGKYGNGSSWAQYNTTYTCALNTKYYLKLKYDKTNFYIYISTDNISYSLIAQEPITETYPSSESLAIGVLGINASNTSFAGTIDLKYFAGKANNIPVFSGNGISNNTYSFNVFKTVGSPSIVDNVASSLSTSNYLTIDKEFIDKLVGCDKFKLVMRFKTGSNLGSGGLVIGYGNNISGGTFSLWVESTGVTPIVFLDNSGTASLNSIGSVTKTINTNTDYEVYFSKNGTSYDFGIRALSESTFTQSAGITNTKTIYSNTQTIGRVGILDSINLKYFQIYAEDDLILQSYLEIPYTWSKTGSKVVDAYYKDRLGYLYLQTGSAPYYMIDEENTAFALPYGEIYGMIRSAGNNFSKPNYASGVSITAPFTAYSGGWIGVKCEYFYNGAGMTCFIDDEVVARFAGGASSSSSYGVMVPIQIGETLTLQKQSWQADTEVKFKFYKNQGV